MSSVVFIGPNEISGIGQVTRTWSRLVPHSDFVELGQPLTKTYDVGFVFILPVDELIHMMKAYYSKHCKRMVYYTICETKPVNEVYRKLLSLSKTIYTSSDFCAGVFKEQFPEGDFRVLRLYAFPTVPIQSLPFDTPWVGKYTFYHIGNIVDPRKNINTLLSAFKELNDPDTALVLKATCKWKVTIDQPNVYIINDFLTPGQMETLHDSCHCYVSCSHSEGAGMGAIEAALRDKPVIIQEYGATTEYVKTPYVIPCDLVPVGQDDFLFRKEHMWGNPDPTALLNFMKTVRDLDVREMNHEYTRTLMDDVKSYFLSKSAFL